MPSSPSFSVAGMSASTSSHHSPNLNTWGSSSTGSALSPGFGDSLSQSRSHYQSGYLMSASQSNDAPQENQRVNEVPVVQTKAKMNHILSRGTAPDFGMDSMFQSSRQRQPLADEDAPPTSSINDIPNEINLDSSPGRFQTRQTGNERPNFSSSRRQNTAPAPSASQTVPPLFVIVFGYPPDKYSLTVEYFRSLGETIDVDTSKDITNCFKIGYADPADAVRAVRKNGEVLNGTWMVGAKWADAAQAEAILGQPIARSPFGASISYNQTPESSSNNSNAMAVDEPYSPSHNANTSTPSVGTPIKLAPSMAAFRKAPGVSGTSSKPATPQHATWGSGLLSTSISTPGQKSTGSVQPSPSKGVIGQMSDLIFGW
ncbi:Nucleoporin nup40 [Psilocybe cubensis]|uniref:RRM Nup35-type domain-containing protein n=2 Tax=Psilocybe cubensis TaxID=181762 RepID=A0A8H7XV37_PSICU|nr:Nucleoporin nup40 [Psilocybe cubensis]KAH9479172.1 Nucleoporin nup40 [Psilocybe cubensis]